MVLFQMMALRSHLERPFFNELSKLLELTKYSLKGEKPMKVSIDRLLPEIFDFRLRAIKWLANGDTFSLPEMMDDVAIQVKELESNPKLQILTENIQFALRCNKRVVDSIMNANVGAIESGIAESPEFNYEQFVGSVTMNVPSPFAQKIINFTNSSLYIEFIMLSAIVIEEEKLNPPDHVLDELAFLIADAAQEYSALAVELGIIKMGVQKQLPSSGDVDKSFVDEQAYISELGFGDFANGID